MAKRSSPRTPHSPSDAATPCPCGRPVVYRDCCGRLHGGTAAAATAEELMRSRYSAFAVGDRDYLLRTWHPRTRPPRLDLDPAREWVRLEVLAATGGGPFDREGAVSFRAVYRHHGHEGEQREHSRFLRHEGAWAYLDAQV